STLKHLLRHIRRGTEGFANEMTALYLKKHVFFNSPGLIECPTKQSSNGRFTGAWVAQEQAMHRLLGRFQAALLAALIKFHQLSKCFNLLLDVIQTDQRIQFGQRVSSIELFVDWQFNSIYRIRLVFFTNNSRSRTGCGCHRIVTIRCQFVDYYRITRDVYLGVCISVYT